MRFLRHVVRAMRMVARDHRIPRPLRWAAALSLLPIPGPFDEAVLVLVAVPLFLFYRRPLLEAWGATAQAAPTDDPAPPPSLHLVK